MRPTESCPGLSTKRHDPQKVLGTSNNPSTPVGGFIRNKQFFAELVLLKASKSKDEVRVRRNGVNAIGSYKHDDSSNVVVLGAVF